MLTYSQNGFLKPQISENMKKIMTEDKTMNQPPHLIQAKIANKQRKEITTGELFVFTLQIEGSDALPNDWSTFDVALFDKVKVGESWQVSVSTKPNMKKPGEVYRNVIEFVERVSPPKKAVPNDSEELAEWEKEAMEEEHMADIPNVNEAMGSPYPPDEKKQSWEDRLMQGLTAKDIQINIAVALKAVTDVLAAKLATPELYSPTNVFDDLVTQTRRVCRECT